MLHVRQTAMLIVALALTASGCAAHDVAQTAAGSAAGTMSPAELRYGIAPTRNSQVIYQPDVIIPDGGANAVRSVSADGLTWTIDATTPHADEVVQGKIMFITGRGVGRVLGTSRTGNDLNVILGPVKITDVIQQAHLSGSQELDESQMTAYTAPDYPEPKEPVSEARPQYQQVSIIDGSASSGSAFVTPGMQIAQALQPGPMPGPPSEINIDDFIFNPFCCGGLGVKVAHNGNDVKMMTSLALYVNHPSVSWDLNITTKGIETAKFELHGASGLQIHFEASSPAGVSGNIHREFLVPVDLNFPILGAPVPIALTVHQSFLVRTAFTAKDATISSTGDYGFTGTIAMACHYSSCKASAPTVWTVNRSILDTMDGKSLGVNALIIGYEARIIVGIGAFGFVTGPYLGFGAFLGVTRGSDASDFITTPCRRADMYISMHVGVGYSMPQRVTDAINIILRALNAKEIGSFDGIELRQPIKELHDQRGCGAK
jgi:hypothetical protein